MRDTRGTEDVAIVGRGRLGTALAASLRTAGVSVIGPLRRGEVEPDAPVILLCVPDAVIASVARQMPRGAILGHCSGALTLEPLGPRAAFSIHPLATISLDTTSLRGVQCAVRWNSVDSHDVCSRLVDALGMQPFELDDRHRPLYHAAAVTACGHLVTLLEASARMMESAGLERGHLLPLIVQTIANWERQGVRAMTGPVVRRDDATLWADRLAIAGSRPELLGLWDAVTDTARSMSAEWAESPER